MLDNRTYIRRLLIALLVVAVAAALWMAAHVLLLLFGAVLFAVVIRGLAGLVRRALPMPDRAAVGTVIALLLVCVGLFAWLFGTSVASQFTQLLQQVPNTASELEGAVRQAPMGDRIIDQMRQQGEGAPLNQLAQWVGHGVTLVLNGLGYLVVVLLAAVYLAFEPDLYRRGLEKLVPRDTVELVRRTLDRCGDALWKWAAGQLVDMLAVGAVTTLGLWLLGVPAPAALGLIAFLLEFIPFIGPILAAIPAVLLALTVGPWLAVWTGLFYLAVQQVEGNILLPLIQRRAVDLPPAVCLFAILLFTALFGVLGALFATPLAVALMVVVQIDYVQAVLKRPVQVTGR